MYRLHGGLGEHWSSPCNRPFCHSTPSPSILFSFLSPLEHLPLPPICRLLCTLFPFTIQLKPAAPFQPQLSPQQRRYTDSRTGPDFIHITGHILSGQATGEKTPGMPYPGSACLHTYVTTVKSHGLQEMYPGVSILHAMEEKEELVSAVGPQVGMMVDNPMIADGST
ncbi:hypothetical protein Q7C36_011518 [Tachysurus vachellii]|uniref:Uncharacterized protein n=1 Tax=Tachysurus vachellii TaxID=175792 RepID=A0AA88SS32_TACVA|nr:hypothetical protein Q7C36_011518 [Tachysurus vachellii]